MTGSTDHAAWNGSFGVHNRHAQQERRSRLLLLHEGSSSGAPFSEAPAGASQNAAASTTSETSS
jgi:hypothetical protein